MQRRNFGSDAPFRRAGTRRTESRRKAIWRCLFPYKNTFIFISPDLARRCPNECSAHRRATWHARHLSRPPSPAADTDDADVRIRTSPLHDARCVIREGERSRECLHRDWSMTAGSPNGIRTRQQSHRESHQSRRIRRALSLEFATRRMSALDPREVRRIDWLSRTTGLADGPARQRRIHRARHQKKKSPASPRTCGASSAISGGDGGIRTLDPGFGPDAPLAGECLRPLGHVSQTFARTREAVRREQDHIGFGAVGQFP